MLLLRAAQKVLAVAWPRNSSHAIYLAGSDFPGHAAFSALARETHLPDNTRGVVCDEQSPVRKHGQTNRPSPDLAGDSVGDEAAQKRFDLARGPAVAKRYENNIESLQLSPPNPSATRDERAVTVTLGKSIAVIEQQAKRD